MGEFRAAETVNSLSQEIRLSQDLTPFDYYHLIVQSFLNVSLSDSSSISIRPPSKINQNSIIVMDVTLIHYQNKHEVSPFCPTNNSTRAKAGDFFSMVVSLIYVYIMKHKLAE